MPDVAAESMSDAQVRPGPALSAVSDMPVIEASANTADEAQAAADEAERVAAEQAATTENAETEEQKAAREAAKEDKKVPVGEVTKERNRRRAAEEAVAAERKRADDLAAAVERLTVKEAPADKPKRADFDDPAVYDAAVDAYNDARVAKAAKDAIEHDRQQRQQEQMNARQQRLSDSYKSNVEAFKADHPDFDDVFTDELTITPQMAIAIAESPYSAAVSYHLGQNPDEATRIAQLSPARQIAEITKIELSLDSPAPKPTPKPKPAPIKPVGQRSGDTDGDPNEMSMEAYAQRRTGQIREQRTH